MTASFPIIIPFLSGILLLFSKNILLQRKVAFSSLVLQLGVISWLLMETYATGHIVSYLGNWKAPMGIVLVVDKTAAVLSVLALLVTTIACISSFREDSSKEQSPLKLPLIQFLLTGIQLSFITGDLFNLFVAFEVMLLSSYGLMTLEGTAKKLKEAFPYVILNVLGSALFLAAAGFAYATFGTLNFAGIAAVAAELNQTADGSVKVKLITALLAFVFAIKAGMFPLYFWLPNSYPILPPSTAAIYAGLLTKVGIYVLLRLLGTVMPHDQDSLYLLIAWLGGGTMLFGVLGAVSKMRVREILSFHVLSQVGFMILAIGFFTEVALAATIFYMMHHIIVKSGLFLSAGMIMKACGTDDLNKTGGLWKATPHAGIAFLILSLSLAGLPPLSGFWAKLWILMEGLTLEYYFLIGVSLVASLLTLASMLKIWLGAFWKAKPADSMEHAKIPSLTSLSTWLMVAVSILVMILIQPLWNASLQAAAELMNTQGYIQAIFGPTN